MNLYPSITMIRFILNVMILSRLTTSAMWIGKLSQYIYLQSVSSSIPTILFPYSSNCQECLCYARSLTNTSIVALNCLNDTRSCVLFTNYSDTYSFQASSRGQVYFFQLPTTRPQTTTATSITTADTSAATRTTAIATSAASQATASILLLNITAPTSSPYPNYNCYSFPWVAPTSSATLSFNIRHDPGAWMLDDVSVCNASASLIINGGFESGGLTGWTYSGACSSYASYVFSSNGARSGSYFYAGTCVNGTDTISQRFSITPGRSCSINFCLSNYACCQPVEAFTATIA